MMMTNIKKVLKMVGRIPYVAVMAPFYLVLYLYEKLLNYVWTIISGNDDEDGPLDGDEAAWIDRWVSQNDTPINDDDEDNE